MSRFIDADKLLNKLPDDLPYKASVKRVLMQAPTADVVEVRHGEWKDDNRLTHSAKFRCSVCDGLAYFPQPTRDKTWKRCCPYKYCPNCGAKMDGERSEDANT